MCLLLLSILASLGETQEQKDARFEEKWKERELRWLEEALEEEYDEIDGIEDADF